jgi:hypothetical protein
MTERGNPMSTRARWVVCAGMVAALGCGVAGGSAGGSAGAVTTSPRVLVHPSASSVSTVAFNFQVTVTGLTSNAVTVSGNGQADLARNAASLTVDLPAAVVALLPGGSTSPEVVKVVVSGGTLYLKIPSLAAFAGKPWISIALPSQATSALPGISSTIASALGDVNAVVSFARGHGATVTPLGTHRIDGVRATGNQIAVAVSRGTAGGTVTAGLWENSSDDLVRATVDAQGTGTANAYGLSATLDLRKYGAPVTISVPPLPKIKAIPFSLVVQLLQQYLHLPGQA